MIKVAFMGAHGTGKTTLNSLLQDELESRGFKVDRVSSITRMLAKDGITINQQGDLLTQVLSFSAHYLELLCKTRACDYLLSDRSIYDDIGYIHTNVLQVDPQERSMLENLILTSTKNFWDHVFFLPVKYPIEGDEVRVEDTEYQSAVDSKMSSLALKRAEMTSRDTQFHTLLTEKSFDEEIQTILKALGV